MQLSPHAFPFLQTLQQAEVGLAAKAAAEHGVTADGPNASDAKAMSMEIFMATLLRREIMRPIGSAGKPR
jgi:hypothetical protein